MTRRSALALVAGSILALAIANRARQVWRPTAASGPTGAPRPAGDSPNAPPSRPVLFVGLDGADWEWLDDLIASGAMPNLAGLARQGRAGILTSLHPPLSPLVWTTMMTGVSPLEHGILDFTRFNPTSRQREPITSDERRAPAIWNVATAAGRSVAVLGLWATYPAEAVRGLVVSDRLVSFQFREASPPAGAVFPADREAWAREAVARAERETDFAALTRYLPWLPEPEYRRLAERSDPYADRVGSLRRLLVETRVYDDLASHYIAEQKPDLAIVYIQGTDAIGHLFAPYAPPRQESIPAREYDRYSRVPEIYFREIDRMLGSYRELARSAGAVLMIASDHGFHWKSDRPAETSSLVAATAGKWHRREGIYLLWGPGIAPSGGRAPSGSVSQVCATLLALLGLPAGSEMAGPPLSGVSAAPGPPADYRASFHPAIRSAAPEASDADETARPGPGPDDETLAKLRALGYIGAGEPAVAPPAAGRPPSAGGAVGTGAPESTRTAGSFNNEGLIQREAGRTDDAVAAFERALLLDPHLASALWNLSDLLFSAGRDPDRSDDLLLRALKEGSPDAARNLIGRAIAWRRAGAIERSLSILGKGAEISPEVADLWLFRGRYRVERGNCREALADFDRALRLDAKNPLLFASRGLARLCLGDRQGASEEFRRSLRLDPDQPEVRRFLQEGR